MEVYDSRFLSLESFPAEEQAKFRDSQLYVSDGSCIVPLLDIYVLQGKNRDGSIRTRKIRNLLDYKVNLKPNKLYTKPEAKYDSLIDNISATIVIDRVSVPDIYTSNSINKTGATDGEKVPYGLKRTLSVEQASAGNGEYLYAFIGKKGTFLKKDSIYWFDGLKKKTYDDAVSEGITLSDIQFFDQYDKPLSAIYTEYEYKFGNVLARERVNWTLNEDVSARSPVPGFTKRTYDIDEKGNAIFSDIPLAKYVSDQQYVTQVETGEHGKKERVNKIKTTNYSVSDDGEYIGVKIDGHLKMVKISELVDKDGNPVSSIKDMVGKVVKVKQGETIVATAEPLTYEQVNISYNTIKTYRPTKENANETSCLRLSDGRYVKELEAVQPLAFKLTDDSATVFDKYLIERTVGGVKTFVIIDKDYFARLGRSSEFNLAKVKKLVRCSFNDRKCAVVQTTSKKEKVENCKLIKNINFATEVAPKSEDSKAQIYSDFKKEYENNNYNVDGVYVDGEFVKLADGHNRFDYTDVTYHDDPASNLFDYKRIRTENIKIVDGKIVGGARYDVSTGIVESYKKWGIALIAGVTVVPLSGIFVPALASAVAVYSLGVLAAAPLIPVVNAAIGAVKNNPLRKLVKYKDKTEHNRNQQEKEIKTEIKKLLTRGDLNERQLKDVYAKIMDDIAMFAQTTSNNSLVVVNGNAEVNSNNANLVNQYIADYKDAKEDYEFYKARIEALKKAGKPIPTKLQELHDQKKAKYDALLNTTIGQDYDHDGRLEDLQTQAATAMLCAYIKNCPDSDFVKALNPDLVSKLKFDKRKGLLLDGISIDAGDKAIEKRFKNQPLDINAWHELKKEVLRAVEDLKELLVDKPVEVDTEGKMSVMDKLNEAVAECELEYNAVVEAVVGYETDYAIMSESKLLSEAILDDVHALADIEETETIASIETLIEAIKNKKVLIGAQLSIVQESKELIQQIDEKTNQFNEVVALVEAACLGVSNYARKTTFLATLEDYKNNVETACDDSKVVTLKADLQDKLTIVESNKALIDELLEQINSLGNKDEKDKMINEIKELYEKIGLVIDSLDSAKVSGILTSFVSILKNNKRVIKGYETKAKLDETDITDIVEMKNKAIRIVELDQIGVKALLVLEKVYESSKAETKSTVGGLINELSEIIRVDKDLTVAQLQEKVHLAKNKYELEILPYLTEINEKEEKARRKAEEKERRREEEERRREEILARGIGADDEYNSDINSENNLRDYLFNRDTDLLAYLDDKGIDVNDSDISAVIDRIDKFHDKGKKAITGAKNLKNPAIYQILYHGQVYITKVIAKGPVEVR